MNHVIPQDSWPISWRESYQYDRQEIYGEILQRGYTYAYQNRLRHAIDMIRKVAAPGASILDVAAAQGNFSLILAEQGYDVTWNDLREELAGYVALKHQTGKIRYHTGNICELPPEDRLYDLVLIAEIIEHVAHPDRFLKNMASLVKPGGWIVMTTPNGEYLRNTLPRFSDCPDPSVYESRQFKPNADGHIFLLHEDEIRRLARQCQLAVVDLRFFTTPLTNGHMKLEPVLKLVPRSTVEQLECTAQRLPWAIRKKLCVQMGAVFQKQAVLQPENAL